MTLESRKYQLIEQITGIEDEILITKLEELLKQLDKGDQVFFHISKPLKEKLVLDQLIEEQGFKSVDRERFDQLVDEINIEEPIEDLLEMI